MILSLSPKIWRNYFMFNYLLRCSLSPNIIHNLNGATSILGYSDFAKRRTPTFFVCFMDYSRSHHHRWILGGLYGSLDCSLEVHPNG